MSRFSEEALKTLNKDELIPIIQEQDIDYGRHDEHMENLVAGVEKLTSSLTKFESKSVISENVTIVLL